MLGETFGRLTVLALSHKNAQGRLFWRCACVCGAQAVTSGTRLRLGVTQSCGCLREDVARGTHRLSDTPEYRSWIAMRHRCNNPARKHYARYGGRGITVCRRWNKFENFLADMGPRPSPEHSLERRKNNKGYSPSNCVWATKKQQARNTCRTVFLTYAGRTQPMIAWAEQLGVAHSTLSWRRQQGWTDAEVINGRGR